MQSSVSEFFSQLSGVIGQEDSTTPPEKNLLAITNVICYPSELYGKTLLLKTLYT